MRHLLDSIVRNSFTRDDNSHQINLFFQGRATVKSPKFFFLFENSNFQKTVDYVPRGGWRRL